MEKERILLINPPKWEVIPHVIEEALNSVIPTDFFSYASQPYGLLKIGNYFKAKGHEVMLIDCAADTRTDKENSVNRLTYLYDKQGGNYEIERITRPLYHCGLSFDKFKERLKKISAPDKIFVTSGMTYNWQPVHKIIEICKEVHPKSEIVLGGIYATLCSEHAKKSGADKVFMGRHPEADEFPSDLTLLDYAPDYAVIKSTRGCPNRCSYCAVSILEGHKMWYRQPEEVVKEIENKVREHSIKKIIFAESNLLMNLKAHFEKILDLIIERNLSIDLEAPEGLQLNLITPELAKKMRKAGMKTVRLPLESTDDKLTRERFHKQSSAHDFIKAATALKEAGFSGADMGVFILIGMPNQPPESIINSFTMVWELDCLPITMPFTPIPSSEEYDKHISFLKNMPLEDLHPLLFPFADDKMRFVDLELLINLTKSKTPFDVLEFHKANTPFQKSLYQKIRNSQKLWSGHCNKLIECWETNYFSENSEKELLHYFNNISFKNKNVLLLGFGIKRYGCFLQKEGAKVYIIDGSNINKFESGTYSNLVNSIQNQNFSNKTYPENFFDIVIDSANLNILDKNDNEEYISMLKKSLKQGGSLLLRSFSKNGAGITRFFRYKSEINKNPAFLNFFGKQELENMFKPGFELKSFKELFWVLSENKKKKEWLPGMYAFIFQKSVKSVK